MWQRTWPILIFNKLMCSFYSDSYFRRKPQCCHFPGLPPNFQNFQVVGTAPRIFPEFRRLPSVWLIGVRSNLMIIKLNLTTFGTKSCRIPEFSFSSEFFKKSEFFLKPCEIGIKIINFPGIFGWTKWEHRKNNARATPLAHIPWPKLQDL